jgi:predicted ATP-grasp superfamily ATP-dependent carboligase
LAESRNLLLFGASTRAAAFSALRAGLQPWCADLFADADLCRACPVIRVPGAVYPHAFLELCRQDLAGPWMYTGGLENWRLLVEVMASSRPLWGNGEGALALARSPAFVATLLHDEGLPHPTVWLRVEQVPRMGRWLVKPLKSAGGTGIRPWERSPTRQYRDKPVYFQEFIEGEAVAAVFLGTGKGAGLLGLTRQLVGERWLHARPYHYCGSIGPRPLPARLRAALERLGNVLGKGCRLRGVFGVDCILRGDVPWPVEVNPRFPASVEVLEYATGLAALPLHAGVFDPTFVAPVASSPASGSAVVGKAILFARESLTFPEDGPWMAALRSPVPFADLPSFADIPKAGIRIEAGQPILTLFARADSEPACQDALRETTARLDHWLFRR